MIGAYYHPSRSLNNIHQDAPYTDKPIPHYTHNGTGYHVTLPMIPSLRPGVVVNQQRLSKVNLTNENMTLTWIPKGQQEIVAPVVWVGSQQINVMTLMLDTLDVVKELAELTAAHTHHNTDTPENASAIRNTAHKSDGLKQKYSPVIG
ncbi:hypothetical protein HZS38_14705 [Xenorhabdus nematophila]|uniref:Uncharacterized protein n=1 Tax=Xenorhabdus nematophila (strain ATCC 19061 / DSM 3370 / CCUG 14189 / LMG 1036 / NCIMB 9965 / AN6) TaxID=406817 RepID=D3VGA5_XENNA|nr:hypothetical protein [Xenorhabdus nematophila]CEE94201.1 hypothetical protein XNA1_4520035 [Xenorhabdus nematophila str. Anatoliense]CEF31317.1 hypothetical protein XNW1_3350003 [Xenorhabdus nematophila str. Websteri]AYA41592.1 hypothetical protein D3790_15080 [Xenorhabdus nematophila]KHD27984.1 hypothetical protein LH67_13895 [Xenorhabdus nematophila]MBA0020331.1 hypothetical protein [Xenorhabdus nematophila]